MRRDSFGQYHPAVNFVFFVLVLAVTMFFMHPVCLLISLAAGAVYDFRLHGGAAYRRKLLYMVPVLLVTVLLNPVFNHEGGTILRYLPNGNPLTLEAVAYGIAAAIMLGGALSWFSCCTAIMTSDKYIYLFGKAAPALSLLLSMVLRFVPRFQERMVQTREAGGASGGAKGKGVLTAFSSTVTWSLENAIRTSDSMKSRGYGIPGRTAFSNYRLSLRDKVALAAELILGGGVLLAGLAGKLAFSFYPFISWGNGDGWTVLGMVAQAGLCLMPVLIDLWENYQWNYCTSKI